MADEQSQLWERLPDEPLRWYQIFKRYYLAAGLSRTVRVAYLAYVQATRPEILEVVADKRGAPALWSSMALKWRWKDRAEAWEDNQTQLAMATVEQASKELRLLAIDAVRALALFLDNGRLGVQAAKEILDRSGLPATTRVEAENIHKFTSDDLAKARDEIAAWQKTKRESG